VGAVRIPHIERPGVPEREPDGTAGFSALKIEYRALIISSGTIKDRC
jgi:hypothetical protein